MIPDKRQALLTASGGFTTANYWNSDGDTEPEGSAEMSRIVVFSPVRKLSDSGNQFLFSKVNNSGTVGWFLSWRSALEYSFIVDDGGGTLRTAEFAPASIPRENECVVLCGSYDEAELICYARGESSVTGPWVGYTSTGQKVTIGAKSNGVTPSTDFNVLAVLATDTYALTLVEMATAEAAIKEMLEQGQRIDSVKLPGTGWNWIWDARDCHKIKKGEWKDQESGVILSETGETQLHAVQARF